VFDTGFDKTLIQSVDCVKCRGNAYDPDSGTEIDPRPKQFSWQDATLDVIKIKDQLCTLWSNCVSELPFYLIESQVGLK
jgi:hypothetical protein